jgi:hypothetical protein
MNQKENTWQKQRKYAKINYSILLWGKKTKHIDNSDEEGITKQISATFIHEHSKEGLNLPSSRP